MPSDRAQDLWLDEELARRRQAWDALGTLFLDTEQRPWLAGIAHTLSALQYDESTLRTIWREEVAPALHWNLKSVAGEWAGFSSDWLEARIVALRRTILVRLT